MKTLSKVQVDLGERSYPIQIGQGWITEVGPIFRELFPKHRYVVITNPAIQKLWGRRILDILAQEGMEADLFEIPDGEEAKNLQTVSQIYDFLIEHHYGRQTVLIALGGGVVGDVAGFAAATFLRGVELVQLPTSLLAMVDSSVGGKTGVNHRLGKNLIGAFKQPRFVGVELDFLATLSDAEFKAGLAEIVKYGMIADAGLFEFLESNADEIFDNNVEILRHIITRSCEIKATIVAEDEVENGVRAILNFGHTFAHAVETLTEYKKFRHGEAVSVGMMAACRLGEIAADFPVRNSDRLEMLLKTMGLPVRLPKFPVEDYLRVMRSDKKVRGGQMRFILPVNIGTVAVADNVEESQVIRALEVSF
ncbi:3-dehydroquinate synthase [Candidatus Sumerlaeota bacterium]|nr:3-dehydroquinate synthase [Candidatus Sumerlaeota bacterium]